MEKPKGKENKGDLECSGHEVKVGCARWWW